ncbi:hypothetical protein DRP04_02375 [Archaeoglobales archaeon]|nr:MAG: hypothetical protein DRP04_02375 [Archaeoglobales archaeon]
MLASNLISSKLHVYWDDPVLLVLNVIAGTGKCSPYRLPVVDSRLKVKGVITGRRLLEVLLGRRGIALRERLGIRGLLRKSVGLFCDEAHNVFSEKTPVQAVAQFMVENNIGSTFIVDETLTFKGVIDETAFLNKMKKRRGDIEVCDIMQTSVYTVSPQANLFNAAQVMLDNRVRRLPVVVNDEVVGIVTITDILKHILIEEKHIPAVLEDSEFALEESVEEIMIRDVAKVGPETDIGTAANQMLKEDVSSLVVVRDEKLEGIVSRIDLISGLARISGIGALIELVKQ